MDDSKDLSPASETMQYVQPTDSSVFISNMLVPGTSLGHYVIKRHIGGGGMGQVYLAADEALDRDVAIKVLTQQRGSDQSVVARFMNEAKSAARLNHEHIAQVYFAGEESGIPFIAFEYVEGINVRIMVEEHDVFPLPQALNYLLQIAHALAHATMHGVVHRDVKPSNILITREGRAKLIDMGLARLLDTSEGRGDLTQSGVTLGTFDYISPEQARDPRNADIRSDIYSLGCTLFYMLAGRPPFPEGTVLQKLLQHQGDAPPDIRSFQPNIPADVAFLIQKMMAKDPKQRFQTPAVLIDALTDVARRLGLRLTGQGLLVLTHTRATRTSFFLRHIPWIAAVALLLLGVLLADVLWNQSDPTGLPPIDQSNSSPVAPPAPPVELTESPIPPLIVADVNPADQNVTAPSVSPSSPVRYVVDPTGNTIDSYLSLASALTDAEDGATVEIKWTGVLRITEPIRFDQRNLQIAAASGCEPILLFEPTNTLNNARCFFSVLSSDLTFQQVGIEFRHNPSVLSPYWSLFEMTGNVRLKFEQCCLTVRNKSIFDNSANHNDVVFFRSGVPAGGTFLEDIIYDEEEMSEPLTIEMQDSILRGEAVAIQSGDVPQDIHVRLTNSFVALAKPFVHVEESRRAVRQTTIQIRWDKVAFFGCQEVVYLYKEISAEPTIVDFESQQSVFVLNRSPFAVFRGTQSWRKILEEFQWSSGANSAGANYFQGATDLQFRISSSSPESRPVEMALEEWRKYWTFDTNASTEIDVLRLTEIVKPMSQYVPSDVRVLSDSTDKVSFPDLGRIPTRWHD